MEILIENMRTCHYNYLLIVIYIQLYKIFKYVLCDKYTYIYKHIMHKQDIFFSPPTTRRDEYSRFCSSFWGKIRFHSVKHRMQLPNEVHCYSKTCSAASK